MGGGYDLVVVGAGHAGCEAAAAAARLGRRVAMVTLHLDRVGALSCNPAIGGMAKGHLVRELDALGGLMGRVADRATVQFRHLNTRKGLAVQSSRAQVDIAIYPRQMRRELDAIEGLDLVQGEVVAVRQSGGRVSGVELSDGRILHSPAVCLTTGTFLRGLMHTGDRRTEGGRIGESAARRLAECLGELGLHLSRLKTGTVPRLDGRTIRWDRVQLQEDTVPGRRFSFGPPQPQPPPLDCSITHTNHRTHQVIRDGLSRSPLYTGVIEGTGPRYCPSIEDKVVRFPDRERHVVFLEPEGHDTHRVYPNGLPTSLPADVQVELVRTIRGLERAEILQLGYAVEYDFADPRDLGRDLQHRALPGLYLAGQVNGTSGYEEAAVQGFVAGVSAARGEVFHVERFEAYIGVLIDDLVSRGIGGEPYRMFTSRAEHRLLLREDNADRRLMARGRALGLIPDSTWGDFQDRLEAIARGRGALAEAAVVPSTAVLERMRRAGLGEARKPISAEELLRRPGATWSAVSRVVALPDLPDPIVEQLEVDVKYAGYIVRARRRMEAARRMERVGLPADEDWSRVPGLSLESVERLVRFRPATLGQLARLPGITPAAVDVVAAWVGRAGPAGL